MEMHPIRCDTSEYIKGNKIFKTGIKKVKEENNF